MRDAAILYNTAFNSGLRPPPSLTVTEWSDAYRFLPRKSSSEPGRYRSSRTPYVREIMDSLTPSNPAEEICCMKGTQLGMTEVGNNWFGYVADIEPAPMMMVFPTIDLAKDHGRQKLTPTIQDTPRLRDKIQDSKSRDSGNTLSVKEFPGGVLFLAGSNSAASFRSKSIRFLFLDDTDGFPADADGEGDPAALARKRTDSFPNRKVFEVSTPTTQGTSRIERSYGDSDQRQYHVPCPFCGAFQVLEFGNIKFTRDAGGAVIDTWYECTKCQKRIDEGHKPVMLENGQWVPKYPERKKRGYHISSLYSPLGWVSWQKIVEEFLEAKSNRERLKVWTNTRLGTPFEERGSQPDWTHLKSRCEPYSFMSVPEGGRLLTAGIDVQDNRLAVVVRAWGIGEESWLIYWGELFGSPGHPEVWKELDTLLGFQFEHASGAFLQIASAAIDTGGHHTQDVYNFVRTRAPRVFAIKGQSQSGKAIINRPTSQDISWKGTTIKKGVQLWPVGSDTGKAVIYARLQQTAPGGGTYHWPLCLSNDYFRQLTAEKLVTRYTKGYPKPEWVKTGPRNEALDCEVYCYAAALRAGLARMKFDTIDMQAVKARQEEQKNPEIAPPAPKAPRKKVTITSKWMKR